MNEKIPYHKPLELEVEDLEDLSLKIKEIIKSGQLTNGKYVQKLEIEIEDLYHVDYCLATSNCTMGLMICIEFLEACTYNVRHNVRTYLQMTSFNWWSVKYLTYFLRQNIKWDDIDLRTWLPQEIYSDKTLYLNTFGNIGKSKRNDTLYDSSHCLGAKIKEIGLAHVFSLAPTKLITACEGGLIITNNKELYEFAKERRDKMCRMSEIHALIGLTYLPHLNKALQWKKDIYEYYKKYIPGQFQVIENNSTYNTIGFLNTENLKIPSHIETRQYYEPIFDNDVKSNTKFVYEHIVCLPSWYGVDKEKIVNDILEYNLVGDRE